MPQAPSLPALQGAPKSVIAPSTWSSSWQNAPGSVNVIAQQGGGGGGERAPKVSSQKKEACWRTSGAQKNTKHTGMLSLQQQAETKNREPCWHSHGRRKSFIHRHIGAPAANNTKTCRHAGPPAASKQKKKTRLNACWHSSGRRKKSTHTGMLALQR